MKTGFLAIAVVLMAIYVISCDSYSLNRPEGELSDEQIPHKRVIRDDAEGGDAAPPAEGGAAAGGAGAAATTPKSANGTGTQIAPAFYKTIPLVILPIITANLMK